VMTRRRHFLPPHPIEWFRGLIAAFGKDLKIRMASKDGVAVASILTLSHKKSMVYKYGCSDAPPRVCPRGCRLFVSERLCITSILQKLNPLRTRNF
jgi:hypothetical protein